MSYRLDEVAVDWLAREKISDQAFEDLIKSEHWKTYDLDTSDPDMQYDKLDVACQKCIFRQIQKYHEKTGFDGKSLTKKFVVPCTGIPKDYVSDDLLEYLNIEKNSEEAEEIAAARDPVEWARKNCFLDHGAPWEPRWYQKIMLR